MTKLIDELSAPATKSELDFFTVPPTQVSIVNGNWEEFRMQNTNTSNGPWEFRMEKNPHALDLSKNYYYLLLKAVNENGTDIAATDNFSVVNLLGKTFFKHIKVSINGKSVYDSSDKYAYRAYMETLLNFGLDSKNSFQQSALYYQDDADKFNDFTNKGFIARKELFANSAMVELMAPLHLGLFTQEKFLLPQTEMSIEFHRNSDAWCIMADAGKKYKLQVADMKMYIHKAEPLASIALGVETTLEKFTAKYPIRRVDMKSMRINTGSYNAPTSALFTGQLPRRVVIGLVDSEAFHGVMNKNPLNFVHANVSEISVCAAGQTFPSIPLQMNYGKKLYMRAFVNLFETMHLTRSNQGNEITYKAFPNGFCLYGFDLTPDADDGSYWQLIKEGSTSVDIKFSKAVEAPGLELICFAEFDNLLYIDHNRNARFDFNV